MFTHVNMVFRVPTKPSVEISSNIPEDLNLHQRRCKNLNQATK